MRKAPSVKLWIVESIRRIFAGHTFTRLFSPRQDPSQHLKAATMKLDEEGKLIEPNVGDAELVRFDFDHAGINVHIRLAASNGAIFVLRIVNARWFSFSTGSSQCVIDRIVITENLNEAAAAAPHHVRDMLWIREQR